MSNLISSKDYCDWIASNKQRVRSSLPSIKQIEAELGDWKAE